MLIRFNVKNVLSFSERENGKSEEFSMIAGKVKSKNNHVYEDDNIRLLKLSAVYGANAAGKSNLVKAIGLMRSIVLNGLPDGHTEKYCKTSSENINKESYFEMEILIDGKYYSYGFEIILSQSKFVSEWLIELIPNNKEYTEKLVFERNIVSGTYNFGDALSDPSVKEKLDLYAEDIATDSSVLFLSLMNRNKKQFYSNYEKASILKDIFKWFLVNLDISYPDRPVSDFKYLVKATQVKDVIRVISAFGTGITDFRIVEVSPEKAFRGLSRGALANIQSVIEKEVAKFRAGDNNKELIIVMRSKDEFFMINIDKEENVKINTIEFSHGKDVFFSLSEESDGTVRILDLLEILLTDSDKTYVVDELDRCLHPSLTYKFIETYLLLASKRNIQLVVTTHESRLLDFDLLRRDEVWFVNKKNTGESDIYSLEEYNTRFDQKIDRAYLEGRYGGVPIFNTIFPVKEY